MINECVYFAEHPPEPARAQWIAWLRHHGIDPNRVAVPGWIGRQEQTRRVEYQSYEWTAQGVPRWDRERDEVVYQVETVQLEARPSPFPPLPDEWVMSLEDYLAESTVAMETPTTFDGHEEAGR